MKDDLTRRDFLRAAGLAAAGVLGASVFASAQPAQENQEEKEKGKKEPSEPSDKADKADKADREKEEPNYNDLFENEGSEEEETRACPQCGALMYRQGRTWTCENCGYSYVE